MSRFTIEQILEAVNDLPTLPHMVIRILEFTDDPKASAQDLGQIISEDQALTARVLRLANSAYYGFSRKVATVTEATVVLGFASIRSLVISASMSDLLNRELEGYALGQGDLWKHSYGSAMAARFVAKKTRYPAIEVAYTAALLHDIGKVILNLFMKEIYHGVRHEVEYSHIALLEAENNVLGLNQARIG